MIIRILTPHQAVRLKIPVMKTRNPPSPTAQSWLTVKKIATALSAVRKTVESTFAEMEAKQ